MKERWGDARICKPAQPTKLLRMYENDKYVRKVRVGGNSLGKVRQSKSDMVNSREEKYTCLGTCLQSGYKCFLRKTNQIHSLLRFGQSVLRHGHVLSDKIFKLL